MQEEQHTEKLEFRFAGPSPNQSDEGLRNLGVDLKCVLCNASPPSNVSSGPDWASCDGCALQAHLGCLARFYDTPSKINAANCSPADLSGSLRLPQTGNEQKLCPSCLQARNHCSQQWQFSTVQVTACFLCRESGNANSVTSLGLYVLQKKQKTPKEEHHEQESLLQILSQALQQGSGKKFDKLRSQLIHPDCLDQALGKAEVYEELQVCENPLKLLLSDSFWGVVAAEDQLPLAQTQLHQEVFSNVKCRYVLKSPIKKSETRADNIYQSTVTQDSSQSKHLAQSSHEISSKVEKSNEEQAQIQMFRETNVLEVDEQLVPTGSAVHLIERNTCQMQKLVASNSKGVEAEKRQTSIKDLMRFEPPKSVPQVSEEKPIAQALTVEVPATRIVHNFSNNQRSSSSTTTSVFSGVFPQKNIDVQMTLAQTTLIAGTTALELGKRMRRAPNKTYESLINQTEEIKRMPSKRARTDGVENEPVQTRLSLFSEPHGVVGQQIKLNLINRPPESLSDVVMTAEDGKMAFADKKLMQTDPFQNPFINEIFKPIMAADKLQVLRKDKEQFDIYLLPKDLKVFGKEKRDQMLANYVPDEDQTGVVDTEEFDDEDNEEDIASRKVTQQSSEEVQAFESQKQKPKRRKKASNLSRQANRRTTPGAELSWISNLHKNRKLQEELLEKNGGRQKQRSHKSRSSKTDSQPTEPTVLPIQQSATLPTQELTTVPIGERQSQPSKEPASQLSQNHAPVTDMDSRIESEDILVLQLKQEIQEKEKHPVILTKPVPEVLQQIQKNEENYNNLPPENLSGETPSDHSKKPTLFQTRLSCADLTQGIEHDIKEEELKGDEETDEPFVFQDRRTVDTVDGLYYRYNMGYYHNLESLQEDFKMLIQKVIITRCKNQLAKDYLNKVLQSALQHLDRKKTDFGQKWKSYYESKFRENQENPMVLNSWQKYPGAKRQYFTIEDYKPVTTKDMVKLPQDLNQETIKRLGASADSEEYQNIVSKMSTSKKSSCGANCPCQDHSIEMKLKLSQTDANIAAIAANKVHLSVLKDEQLAQTQKDESEDSECCFQRKVECGAICGCNPATCRNRQMSQKQHLRLGKEVEERTAWGMDMYTAINLCTLRPKDVPALLFSEFLEHRLMFSVQQQGADGYDIRKALQFIIESKATYDESAVDAKLEKEQLAIWNDRLDPFQFSYMEKELSRIILEAIQGLKGQNDPHFRIHSKGLGIFCNVKEGIRKNSLLVEYFGEIYPQWLWYEKQDVLKQGQTKGSLSKDLPDFYNITYERHFDDPDGYDVLTVDPILFGNFASRLSHSCNPNCETVTKVKQDAGIYSIGMFTQKSIKYGEELCFNYCSFTESEEEFRSAACLCGSTICQGRFLNLATAQKNQGMMKEYHTFIDRNLILYNAVIACSPGGQGITIDDQERLDKFGIKNSVLSDIPIWLKKWAALICEFIEFEQIKYSETQEGKQNPEIVAIELKNLRDSKLSNIAITIDKVARILKLMGTSLPPIRKMSQAEVYFALWSGPYSLKHQLEEVLRTIEPCSEVQNCFDFIENARVEGQGQSQNDAPMKSEDDGDDDEFLEKVKQVRTILLFISQELRGFKSNRVTIPALCDNLVLYARTETYFTPNDYSKCTGKEIHIRKCDVAGQASDQVSFELAVKDQGKTVYRGTKEYQAHHIWGQLVGWYKQTVDKPNSSLSADRRGSLSMPDIDSFIVTAKNQNDLDSGRTNTKKKRGKNGRKNSSDEFQEEVMPTLGSSSRRNSNRYGVSGTSANKKAGPTHDVEGIYILPADKDIKIAYPHKKYQSRDQFLQHWEEFFSKNWHTCCHWSFKNKHKLYGSISFESVLKAGRDREKRLDYFKEVVEELRGYSS